MPSLKAFLLCWYPVDTLSNTTLEVCLIGQATLSLAVSKVDDTSSLMLAVSCCGGSRKRKFLFKIQTFYTYMCILAKCVPTVKTNTINNLQVSSKKPVLDIWSTLPLQVDTARLVPSLLGGPVLCRPMNWLLQLRIIQFSYKCRALMFHNVIKHQNILTFFINASICWFIWQNTWTVSFKMFPLMLSLTNSSRIHEAEL